jgi:CheY-like chemotaxis protein
MPDRRKVLDADSTGRLLIPVSPPAPQLVPFEMKIDAIAAVPAATGDTTVVELDSQPLPAPTAGSILILEDDLSIRKLLRRLLERRGYQVVEIAQVEDVARELRHRPIELVIEDISGAGEAGIHTLLALARSHPGLKILALSAQSLKDCEIPGRVLALPKPFSLDRFVACVDRLLEQSSSAHNGL